MTWERASIGARVKPHLPVTLDSVRSRLEHYKGAHEEVVPGHFFIARNRIVNDVWWKRLYHAWLVIRGRAIAVQFTRDHYELAGMETLPEGLSEKKHWPSPAERHAEELEKAVADALSEQSQSSASAQADTPTNLAGTSPTV